MKSQVTIGIFYIIQLLVHQTLTYSINNLDAPTNKRDIQEENKGLLPGDEMKGEGRCFSCAVGYAALAAGAGMAAKKMSEKGWNWKGASEDKTSKNKDLTPLTTEKPKDEETTTTTTAAPARK